MHLHEMEWGVEAGGVGGQCLVKLDDESTDESRHLRPTREYGLRSEDMNSPRALVIAVAQGEYKGSNITAQFLTPCTLFIYNRG